MLTDEVERRCTTVRRTQDAGRRTQLPYLNLLEQTSIVSPLLKCRPVEDHKGLKVPIQPDSNQPFLMSRHSPFTRIISCGQNYSTVLYCTSVRRELDYCPALGPSSPGSRGVIATDANWQGKWPSKKTVRWTSPLRYDGCGGLHGDPWLLANTAIMPLSCPVKLVCWSGLINHASARKANHFSGTKRA
jgi:hypothetical protein